MQEQKPGYQPTGEDMSSREAELAAAAEEHLRKSPEDQKKAVEEALEEARRRFEKKDQGAA